MKTFYLEVNYDPGRSGTTLKNIVADSRWIESPGRGGGLERTLILLTPLDAANDGNWGVKRPLCRSGVGLANCQKSHGLLLAIMKSASSY